MINGWPSTRAEVKEEGQLYWPFRDGVAVTDCLVIKVRGISVTASL